MRQKSPFQFSKHYLQMVVHCTCINIIVINGPKIVTTRSLFYEKIIKNKIPTKFLNVLPVLTRLLMTSHHMYYPKENRIKVTLRYSLFDHIHY